KPPRTGNRGFAAIVTIPATSLPKIDVDERLITTASVEAVADPANGSNERRMFCVVPELLAHATDEHVDGAVEGLRIDATDGFHDAIAAQHAPAVSDEKADQLELGGRQRE